MLRIGASVCCLCGRRSLSTTAALRWRDYDSSEYLIPGEAPLKRIGQLWKFEIDRWKRRHSEAKNDPYGRKNPYTDLSPNAVQRYELLPVHTDFLIIGGGIVGSSVAFWLKQRVRDEDLHVAVMEDDDTFTRGSTVLSSGGLQQQFSIQQNIEMSLFGAEFMRNAGEHLRIDDNDPPEINFTPMGHLFLATSEDGATKMEQNWKMQTELGAKVALLKPDQLRQRFPFMQFDDVVLGSLGLENEGVVDPWQVLQAIREKNITLGVYYVKGKVEGFDFDENPYRKPYVDPLTGQIYKRLCGVWYRPQKSDASPRVCRSMCIVNCAGPWAGELSAMAGIGTGRGVMSVPVPIEPRKRYIYVVHCPNGPSLDMPFLCDPSGVWIRRENYGNTYICGRSPTEEEDTKIDHSNLDVDYDYFTDTIWPVLAARIPAFESLKVKSAWAGYYDYNYFDQNPLIGAHLVYDNLFHICGFSGHGLQHAVAAGRAFMEKHYDGAYQTINLRRYDFNRILNKHPLRESAIV